MKSRPPKQPQGKLLTAVIQWDERAHDGVFVGNVLALFSDGRVWARAVEQGITEITVRYRQWRRFEKLDELRRDHRGDQDGFAKAFRDLYRMKDYEICSPKMMEELREVPRGTNNKTRNRDLPRLLPNLGFR